MSGDVIDRGADLGDGLFETVLLVRGAAPLLDLHLDRLRRSAAALALPCPEDLAPRVRRSAAAAWRRAGEPARAALRIRVASTGARGLSRAPSGGGGASPCTLTCRVAPLPRRRFGAPSAPVAAVTVHAHRIDPGSALAGHKTLSWLGFVLARREAEERGADVGLVPTVAGDIAEADFANVFVVRDGSVATPSLARGALPGITRGRALAALRAAGRAPREIRLRPGALREADEVFLTSSLAGVTPVSSVDGTPLEAPGGVALWLAGCLESGRGPRQYPGQRH